MISEEEKVRNLEEDFEELKNEFHAYVKQKNEEEAKRMKTALMVAGGVILTLATFIWTEILYPGLKMTILKP